ncbi:S-formylglutathione hydrolase [Trametes pubescens]|uniref:S-formylglutathione hydrolase n=1 Tax=Trametes pubescens TaxID=154538 RepID=A0A1M2V539_TRAPU|nr:S-formylglutathione hydrolase [Trametes pubescens]
MSLEQVSANKAFDGQLIKYKFKSDALGGLVANFNLFLPGNANDGNKVPLLTYLSGLTCTEDNAAQKGHFLGPAAKEGIAILFPDTSPRGAGVEGETDSWDFGVGAGFYLNATNPKWAKHYNMLTHITVELPQVIEAAGIPVDFKRQSIFGHSMGGHGALTFYLNSVLAGEKRYRSVSAFAPISNPVNCAWGQKAFGGYLQGGVEEARAKYDATELVGKLGKEPVHILVDYGTGDNFYKQGQLLPENFLKAAREAGYDEVQVRVRAQEGYDHSYFFISTFGEDHVHFHANFLKA